MTRITFAAQVENPRRLLRLGRNNHARCSQVLETAQALCRVAATFFKRRPRKKNRESCVWPVVCVDLWLVRLACLFFSPRTRALSRLLCFCRCLVGGESENSGRVAMVGHVELSFGRIAWIVGLAESHESQTRANRRA